MANDKTNALEGLHQRIVDSTRDGVIFADTEGIIRLWNAGAEAIFGFDAAEALGQKLDLIVPERFQERHGDGYNKVMETGVTRYAEDLLAVPAARKDGTRISIEFTISLLKGDDGGVQGAAAVVRDTTERFQRDRATAQRLSELEARVKEIEGGNPGT